MMAKPLGARRELARQLREISVDAASNKPEDIMDVNQAAVEQQLQAASVDRIVHGHTHRPARHAVGSGERIVLGDWTTEKGWYLRERGNDLSLNSFAIR
jgi:UDP-2,3-diacylglucosamine hydrolase